MSPVSPQDEAYLRRALALAEKGRGKTGHNPLVGAVFVRNNQIIGEGFHQEFGGPHAEIEAMRAAGGDLRGATLYVTLEPCCHHGKTPPCTQALIEAGIKRVVASSVDPFPEVRGRGFKQLEDEGIEVEVGALNSLVRRQNEIFFTYHEKSRPFCIAKWAITLDGRTSTDTGDSKWISNELSRGYVQELRTQVDAILVGIGTVITDNPRLNIRIPGYTGPQPTKIIVDGHLRTPSQSRCLTRENSGPVIVAATSVASQEKINRFREMGHSVLVCKGHKGIVDPKDMMGRLAGEGIRSLLAEGGRTVHTSLLRHRLVDKLVTFVAPKVVGGLSLRGPLEELGTLSMKDALTLHEVKIRSFGTDMCIEGYLEEPDAAH
ncbi:MAG: bifunctional diaminohydroxyphosphoribosylaminopyrimidine deaminase/5-amino-6-(5-phosphoribosylamino)uracil reductase RibD [bacterium]